MAISATALWDAPTGALHAPTHAQRLLLEIRAKLTSTVTTIWLTSDGTSTGSWFLNSLVAHAHMIDVQLTGMVPSAGGSLSSSFGWGPMVDSTVGSSSRQYYWYSGYDATSGRPYVTITLTHSSGAGEITGGGRTAVILVAGRGAQI